MNIMRRQSQGRRVQESSNFREKLDLLKESIAHSLKKSRNSVQHSGSKTRRLHGEDPLPSQRTKRKLVQGDHWEYRKEESLGQGSAARHKKIDLSKMKVNKENQFVVLREELLLTQAKHDSRVDRLELECQRLKDSEAGMRHKLQDSLDRNRYLEAELAEVSRAKAQVEARCREQLSKMQAQFKSALNSMEESRDYAYLFGNQVMQKLTEQQKDRAGFNSALEEQGGMQLDIKLYDTIFRVEREETGCQTEFFADLQEVSKQQQQTQRRQAPKLPRFQQCSLDSLRDCSTIKEEIKMPEPIPDDQLHFLKIQDIALLRHQRKIQAILYYITQSAADIAVQTTGGQRSSSVQTQYPRFISKEAQTYLCQNSCCQTEALRLADCSTQSQPRVGQGCQCQPIAVSSVSAQTTYRNTRYAQCESIQLANTSVLSITLCQPQKYQQLLRLAPQQITVLPTRNKVMMKDTSNQPKERVFTCVKTYQHVLEPSRCFGVGSCYAFAQQYKSVLSVESNYALNYSVQRKIAFGQSYSVSITPIITRDSLHEQTIEHPAQEPTTSCEPVNDSPHQRLLQMSQSFSFTYSQAPVQRNILVLSQVQATVLPKPRNHNQSSSFNVSVLNTKLRRMSISQNYLIASGPTEQAHSCTQTMKVDSMQSASQSLKEQIQTATQTLRVHSIYNTISSTVQATLKVETAVQTQTGQCVTQDNQTQIEHEDRTGCSQLTQTQQLRQTCQTQTYSSATQQTFVQTTFDISNRVTVIHEKIELRAQSTQHDFAQTDINAVNRQRSLSYFESCTVLPTSISDYASAVQTQDLKNSSNQSTTQTEALKLEQVSTTAQTQLRQDSSQTQLTQMTDRIIGTQIPRLSALQPMTMTIDFKPATGYSATSFSTQTLEHPVRQFASVVQVTINIQKNNLNLGAQKESNTFMERFAQTDRDYCPGHCFKQVQLAIAAALQDEQFILEQCPEQLKTVLDKVRLMCRSVFQIEPESSMSAKSGLSLLQPLQGLKLTSAKHTQTQLLGFQSQEVGRLICELLTKENSAKLEKAEIEESLHTLKDELAQKNKQMAALGKENSELKKTCEINGAGVKAILANFLELASENKRSEAKVVLKMLINILEPDPELKRKVETKLFKDSKFWPF